MARKSIQTNYYLFDASEREVVIPGGIQREQLILITNVTDNKVIYNFSDPELTATEYHISTDIRNNTTTRVILAYDTTSMSDSDKLQIIYDDFEETVKPAETYHDAVNKSKVSTPQSQIDTDFEYGTQSTKWESLAMINNNPFAYKSDTPINVTAVNADAADSRVIKVTVNTGDPLPAAGTAIFVQDTIFEGANGIFIVDESGTGGDLNLNSNQFAYTAKYAYTAGGGSIRDSARTAVFTGVHYTGSDIGGTITLAAQADGSVQVTCSNVHGLEVGNEVAVTGSAGINVNGSWTVARVTSPRVFFYYPNGTPSGSVNTGTIKLYPRPQGDSIHRAFDGGVKFSTNSFSKNQQAIRQTKRYFRYQSGKGVAFSTGSILAPAIENIDEISASGTTVTVVASVPHNLTTDTIVDVRNCNDNLYNGEYQVSEVINAYTFKYEVPTAPTESLAAGEYTVTPINSYGTNLDIGMMDQQNGIFFRYSNGALSVVRRTSTFQLSGKVSVTNGDSLVSSYAGPNQEPTKFSRQLKPGDYVSIRGSSYRVDGIISDTQMVVFPDYRGPSADNVIVTKTVETVWEQSDWNLDRCDGTGKSGYTLDVTKMQMFYMDYSWYGAGFIRWGFRALDGNVIYVHKIPNNNQNTEAYMRSGNLPARYEVNTIASSLEVYKDFGTSSTIIYTNKSPRLFPPAGTLRIRKTTTSSPITATYEYVNYASKIEYKQDVIRVFNNDIFVSNTASLTAGGTQPIIFDRPFSNIVAGKRYFVASKTSSSFQITDTEGNSTGITLTDQIGSALSPLAIAESGAFTSITREKSGELTGIDLTIADGTSTATVTSSANLQIGQRVIGTGIDANTYVVSIPNGTSVKLSKAVTTANPTGVKFVPMSNGSAQTFTYDATQPTTVELIQATSVPTISHWGSSVIMDGRLDDDRAYVYTVGTKTGRNIAVNDTRSILALRVAPSVDNGITGAFGTRELVNRMQLVMDGISVSASKTFFVEIVLNPTISQAATWQDVGGTSLAQYAILGNNSELVGGEVIFGFYAEGSTLGAATNYDLSKVKEISNSILGGGGATLPVANGSNPTGIFPDGPEVLAIRATNLGGGFGFSSGSIDTRFSWTEAQA